MAATLMLGDCLEVMKDIPDGTVDMVLADLPYGTTQCKWDTVLDLAVMWAQYERVCRESGAIVLFGSQPFTSALVMSRPELFRYHWVWVKSRATGHLNAKKMPMRNTEDVLVFYRRQGTYNPQMTEGEPYRIDCRTKGTELYGAQRPVLFENKGTRYPVTTLSIKSGSNLHDKPVHPTQKPVALLEYLIKTYTNEGETVLDNTMGSGSTGVACANTGRKFIGIEKDPKYFEIAEKRIFDAFPPFVKQVQEPDSDG